MVGGKQPQYIGVGPSREPGSHRRWLALFDNASRDSETQNDMKTTAG